MYSKHSIPSNTNVPNTLHLKTEEKRLSNIFNFPDNEKESHLKLAVLDYSVPKHDNSLCFPSLDLTKDDKEKNLLLQYDKVASKSSSSTMVFPFKTSKTIEKGSSYHWRSAFPVNFSYQSKRNPSSIPSKTNKLTPTLLTPQKNTRSNSNKHDTILDLQSKLSSRSNHLSSPEGQSYRPPSSKLHSFKSPTAMKFIPESDFLKNLSPTRCRKVLECNFSSTPDSNLKVSNEDSYHHHHSTNSQVTSIPTIFKVLRDSNRYGDVIGSLLPSLPPPPPSPLPSLLSQRSSALSSITSQSKSAVNFTSFLPTTEDHILIRTGYNSHQDFLIPTSFIYQSKTLLHFLSCSSSFIEYHEKSIRLPSIEPNVFQSILEYLSFDTSRSSKNPWAPPDDLVLEIAAAAFYLNLPTVVDACAKKIVELLPHIESFEYTPPPLLHIYLKHFSIDQLLHTEFNLLPKELSLDMKPYWLSHLHKDSSPLLASDACPSFTTDSIRSYLSPSIALPLPSTTHSETFTSFHFTSKNKYHLPYQVVTDTSIRFYSNFFQHHHCDLHLILLKNSNLVFSPSSAHSSSLAMPKFSGKPARMHPHELPMALGDLYVTPEDLQEAYSPACSNSTHDRFPTVTDSDTRILVQLSLTQVSFSSRNQLSILTWWPIIHLTLEECLLSESQFSSFCSWLQTSPRLTRLSVHRCFGVSCLGKFFQALSFHPSLTILKVSILMKEHEQLQDKTLLKSFASITTLSHLTQFGFTHFFFMPSLLISTLDLLLACHSWLVQLDLSYTRLGSQFTKLFQVSWTQLTHLNLKHTHLPISTLQYAFQQLSPAFPKLTHLDMSFNPFTMSVLEQCTWTLPFTRLTHFTFNLSSSSTLPNLAVYSSFFNQGLPSTLTFLSFQHHVIPLTTVLDLLSRRSMFLVCQLDSPIRKEVKRQFKNTPFPCVLWCDDGIFTNLPLTPRSN